MEFNEFPSFDDDFGSDLVSIDESTTALAEIDIEEEIKELLIKEKEVCEAFLDAIKIETEMGIQYGMARKCIIPKSEAMDYTVDGFCEGYRSCILYQMKNPPQGHTCPFEQNLIKTQSEAMITSFGIKPDRDFIDMQTVSDYIVYSLMKYRAMKAISSTSLTSVTKEMTKFGTNYKKGINPHFDALVIAEAGIKQIKKELIATRNDKVTLKIEAAKIDNKQKAEKELMDRLAKETSVSNNKMPLIIDYDE